MGTCSVFAIVLAAGEASRFGATKQLAEFHGEPLVRRAVRTAQSACGERTVLVTGNDWRRVLAACNPLQGYFVLNENYRDGIGSSVAMAARSVGPVADAILVTLADQPLVTADLLRQLIDAWESSPETVVATRYDDTMGPPAVFPRSYIAALAGLEGDRGAKSIIASASARSIRFDAAAADVDRPEDIERFQSG